MTKATAIDNVRVFTADGLTEPQRVCVEGDRIVAARTSDSAVDGTGKVLLPGLIDAHMHVLARVDLENLVMWGVTTGLDMAAWPAQFVDRMRAQTGVAQIRSAMTPAVGPGGNHAKMPGFPREGILTTSQDARGFVETQAAAGADYIKIVTEAAPPAGMDQETVNSIVEVAHEHGLLVIAHSITTGAVHVAVDAGVDVNTHAPLDAVLDDETVERMQTAEMVSSPTLTMMHGIADVRADDGLRYEYARDTVTKLHAAGIRLLVGTDANSAAGVPFAPKHGESMHDELVLMVAAGLTPTEALRGATSLTAQTFGLHDRGVVKPGKRADLVLVAGDPTTDIAATRNIVGVWLAGERIR